MQHALTYFFYFCRPHFIDVLEELERRRSIDEQSYWDFQALDYNGTNRICLKDAFLLFREFHQERYLASSNSFEFNFRKYTTHVKQGFVNCKFLMQSYQFDIMMFISEFDWYCFSSWCMYSDCKQIKQKHWTPFIVLDFGLKCCGCSFLPNMYMEGWVQIYSPLFSPCSLQMHKYTDLLLQWHQLKVKVQSKFKQNFYFICISSSVILTCLAVKSSKMLGFFLMSNIFIN